MTRAPEDPHGGGGRDALDDRVLRLVEDVLESGRTPEEVCLESPDLLDEVRDRSRRVRALDARIDTLFSSSRGDPASRGSSSGDVRIEELRIPGYAVESVLGRGGMGTVYKARRVPGDAATDAFVALKLVHPHLLDVPGLRQRFLREADLGTRVVHDNVVRTLEFGTAVLDGAERPFLVMEYVEGQTLRALLAELGRVPEELCRHVGREVARGLSAIHAAGAVHRDLKPENVLITKDHVVKVMDLGVARLSGAAEDLSRHGAFLGSVRYASPEQLRRGGPELDGRADLHALGVLLYELATGRHPFQADDVRAVMRAILEDSPRRAGAVNAQLSPFLEEVIACLVEKDRDARFPSARELAEVLEQGERSAWWSERSRAIRASTRRPLRRVRIPRETALHGRAQEVASLSALFSRARSGEGQVVLIEGEAGVGKSRLVDEFASLLRASGEDFDVLSGGYAPGGAATANSAFAIAFRDHFGEDDLDGSLAEHLDRAAALAPAFASLLRGETPPPGHAPLTKDALQTAFVRTTQSLARRRPVLVLIEDLHLAPDEGRALFAALALAVSGDRVLLVGTARRRLDEAWAAEVAALPHASRVALGRLTREQVTALLSDALGTPSLAGDLAPLVFEKSDGNPFFVFEILRDLRECKLLAPTADGAWVATKLIDRLRSPASIRDLIQARIGKLAADDREILHVAACCGFEFDPLLVGQALQLPVLSLLRRLCELEISHRLVRSAGRSYVFDHHQMQEVIHDGLSQVHREHYHASIAAALEQSTGAAAARVEDVDGALCVELTRHFFDGAQSERALRYLDRALDNLEKDFRNAAADRLLDRTLAARGLVTGRRRGELALRRARALAMLGRSDDEAEVLAEAIRVARAADDPALLAGAQFERAGHFLRTSQPEEARAALEEANDLHHGLGDRHGEALAAGRLGSVLLDLGRFDEAIAQFERSRALCRELGDRRGEGLATGNIGNALQFLGRFEETRRCHEEHIAIAVETGDLQSRMRATTNLGTTLGTLGRIEEACTLQEEGVRIARRIGDRVGEAFTLGNLGIALTSLGRYAEARDRLEQSAALLAETGSRRGSAICSIALANVSACLGRFDVAASHSERALAVAREIGQRAVEANAHVVMGGVLVDEGRPDDALARFDRCAERLRESGFAEVEAMLHLGRGTAFAMLGRTTDAIASFDRAIEVARDFALFTHLVVAAADRARLPGGDPRQAAAWLDEHGSRVALAERTQASWRIWQTSGDPRRLADAKRLLAFMVENAPRDARTSIVENVAVHREIAAAETPV